MAERYYTSLDQYDSRWLGNSPTNQHAWSVLPADFWGHSGYTAYNLSPPLTSKKTNWEFSIAVAQGLVSNDIFQGGQHSDQFFGGAGADQIAGRDHDDQLVGGSGDDLLIGSAGNDILLGDWAEYPNIISKYNWAIPKQNSGLSGDDRLFGGTRRPSRGTGSTRRKILPPRPEGRGRQPPCDPQRQEGRSSDRPERRQEGWGRRDHQVQGW